MAVPSLLAQRRARLPGLGEASGPQGCRYRRPQGCIGRCHDPPGVVTSGDGTPEQGEDREEVGTRRHTAGLAERLSCRDGPHPAQRRGSDHIPATRHRPGDHRGVEVVEGRCNGAGADPTERRRAPGEVARPEPAQSGLSVGRTAALVEVRDGVDGFESDPEVPRTGRVCPLDQRVTWRTPVGEVSG